MDFFDAQARARARSLQIVGLAFAAFAVIAVLVYAAGLGLWHLADRDPVFSVLTEGAGGAGGGWWRPGLFCVTTAFVTLVVGGGAFVRLRELRDGGNAVAHALGARLVRYDTAEFSGRRLVNIVEELSIASGVRIPELFILENEEGINSFCAGHSSDTAVVIVTRGAADMLSRDELQAILAHEFSHILNGDMRINTFLVGVLHGFLVFTISGRELLQLQLRLSNVFLILTGVAFVAIGSLGRLLGSAIQAMLCRQREWLADAHAVQFTRNPAAFAGALKKIGGHWRGSLVPRPHAVEAAHLFFADPLGSRWFFRSHPSLVRRVRTVEPRFDGRFPRLRGADVVPPPPGVSWRELVRLRREALRERGEAAQERGAAGDVVGGDDALERGAAAAGGGGNGGGGAGGAAVFSAGGAAGPGKPLPPSPSSLSSSPPSLPPSLPPLLPASLPAAGGGVRGGGAPLFAEALIGSIPPLLREAAHDGALAPAVFFGLLIPPGAGGAPEALLSPAERGRLARLRAEFPALPPGARLALADLALPALRAAGPERAAAFLRTVDALVLADSRVSLHEFALRHMARRHLQPGAGPARRHLHAGSLARPVCTVLGALAHAGHPLSGEGAAAAFRAGVEALPAFVRRRLRLPAPEATPPAALMEALRELDGAVPHLKKMLLGAFARAIGYDSILSPGEEELLRIITAALDCPAPPLDAAAEGA